MLGCRREGEDVVHPSVNEAVPRAALAGTAAMASTPRATKSVGEASYADQR
jgi:hypothetical protein